MIVFLKISSIHDRLAFRFFFFNENVEKCENFLEISNNLRIIHKCDHPSRREDGKEMVIITVSVVI